MDSGLPGAGVVKRPHTFWATADPWSESPRTTKTPQILMGRAYRPDCHGVKSEVNLSSNLAGNRSARADYGCRDPEPLEEEELGSLSAPKPEPELESVADTSFRLVLIEVFAWLVKPER